MLATAKHHAALAEWRMTAPANNSAILPRRAKTDNPKLAHLAGPGLFGPILQWRALTDVLGADWLPATAVNDNGQGEDRSTDSTLENV